MSASLEINCNVVSADRVVFDEGDAEDFRITTYAFGQVGTIVVPTRAVPAIREYLDTLPSPGPRSNEQIAADELAAAVANCEEVTFVYAKSSAIGDRKRRYVVLNEGSLSESASGVKLVTGWDTERDEPRAFRLDRICGSVEVI